mgnify:CR=1 FL=1
MTHPIIIWRKSGAGKKRLLSPAVHMDKMIAIFFAAGAVSLGIAVCIQQGAVGRHAADVGDGRILPHIDSVVDASAQMLRKMPIYFRINVIPVMPAMHPHRMEYHHDAHLSNSMICQYDNRMRHCTVFVNVR